MDLSSLSSLTGGGGLDAGSQAGGNDQLTGGAPITFGYLPPLPSLPSLPGMPSLPTIGGSSVSLQSNGVFLWVLLAVGIVAAYVYLQKRG